MQQRFYIKLANGKYPVSIGEIRFRNPNVSLPDEPDVEALSGLGFAPVNPTEAPAAESLAKRVVESAPQLNGLGEYIQVWRVVDLGEDELRTLTARLKGEAKARVTSYRWHRETNGIVLPSGVAVATKKDDQDRIDTVLNSMERYGLATVDFKAALGWVTLTYDELKAVGSAIAAHVQACFSAERTHHEAIDAIGELDADAVVAHDVYAGWPTNA